ncbi:MAG: Ig-like domain-containing protein, partial [Candidatus Magasanikbacteria bacterium]|nr:Ig-like domain-containing protein [Candidatus Magasanikbacteria bacterium]
PVEKGEKGWPINPIGAVLLLVFGLVIIFLIVKPLLSQKTSSGQDQQSVSQGGKITSPQAGDIIRTDTLPIEISVDEPQKADKVQFWVKTYADGKWNMIGEVTQAPYKLNWQIPAEYKNKAIAITTHIITKDAKDIKDPGGWREGIIILSQ